MTNAQKKAAAQNAAAEKTRAEQRAKDEATTTLDPRTASMQEVADAIGAGTITPGVGTDWIRQIQERERREASGNSWMSLDPAKLLRSHANRVTLLRFGKAEGSKRTIETRIGTLLSALKNLVDDARTLRVHAVECDQIEEALAAKSIQFAPIDRAHTDRARRIAASVDIGDAVSLDSADVVYLNTANLNRG